MFSGNRWQPVATDLLVFAALGAGAFATGCHWLRPLGSHKRSILRRHEQDFVCAVLAGTALGEERQLHGYCVRLRVVEEYDVALLAESPVDARARAEADLRRGGVTSSKAWAQARRGRTETVAR